MLLSPIILGVDVKECGVLVNEAAASQLPLILNSPISRFMLSFHFPALFDVLILWTMEDVLQSS